MDTKDPKESKKIVRRGAESLVRPHYYGKVDGVHIWQHTDDSHSQMVGEHIENPTDDELKTAISSAKEKKTPAVVVRGTPPEMLRARLSSSMGPIISKSENSSLEKAYLHNDQQTKTDLLTHLTSLGTVSKELMEWGADKLVPLEKDAVETIDLFGRTIKVRKLDPDIYSGWIEDSGQKIHGFERVTLPELLAQIQSKLELYNKPEPKPVSDSPSLEEKIEQLQAAIRTHAKELGFEIPDDELDLTDKKKAKRSLKKLRDKVSAAIVKEPTNETEQEENREAQTFKEANEDRKKKILFEEVNEIERQVKEIHEHVVAQDPRAPIEISSKELMPGLVRPETQCQDCEQSVDECLCYVGLPRPRLEFDGKKVTIFFKSEWDFESRESFIEDLKRRAGRLLRRRALIPKKQI